MIEDLYHLIPETTISLLHPNEAPRQFIVGKEGYPTGFVVNDILQYYLSLPAEPSPAPEIDPPPAQTAGTSCSTR